MLMQMTRETSFASSSGSFKNRPIVEFPMEPGSVDSSDSGNQNEHAKSSTSTTDGSYLSMPQGALVNAIGSLGARTGSDQGISRAVCLQAIIVFSEMCAVCISILNICPQMLPYSVFP